MGTSATDLDRSIVRRVAISGASGFIGGGLSRRLEREGIAVIPLVRTGAAGAGEVAWNPRTGEIDREGLEGVHAVVHLAGENLGQRWTKEVRDRIRASRVEGTRLLAETLASLRDPPEVLVSGSAVGYYGDRGDEPLEEDSAPGGDFLARVARDWEDAAEPAARAGIRVVHPRFGVVLSAEGGALSRMLAPFRFGVGGRIGSGHQWLSWIALDDALDAIRFLIEEPGLSGAFNVTAPEPVTNRDFTRVAGRILHRPTFFTVPPIALRLMFGEMADRTLLASQRALPRRLLDAGFTFRHPRLENALEALLAQDRSQ